MSVETDPQKAPAKLSVWGRIKAIAGMSWTLAMIYVFTLGVREHLFGLGNFATIATSDWEHLTHPGAWLPQAVAIVFFLLFIAGAFLHSRQRPEDGSFSWILFKSSLSLLGGLLLLPIVGALFYALYLAMFG